MLILNLLVLAGLALPFLFLGRFIRGIRAGNIRQCVTAAAIPVVFWALLVALLYADRKFIEEETRKNGGQLPQWVW